MGCHVHELILLASSLIQFNMCLITSRNWVLTAPEQRPVLKMCVYIYFSFVFYFFLALSSSFVPILIGTVRLLVSTSCLFSRKTLFSFFLFEEVDSRRTHTLTQLARALQSGKSTKQKRKSKNLKCKTQNSCLLVGSFVRLVSHVRNFLTWSCRFIWIELNERRQNEL